MKVKLCGFSEESSLQVAVAEKCDFLGFVFVEKSPRFISPKKAAAIATKVPTNIARVAVVVDADFDFISEIVKEFSPDFFQFHGSETVDFLEKFHQKFPKIKIIKAFRIHDSSDLKAAHDFENIADLFLFDGKDAGSGKKFDWKILQNFSAKKDWFLSGGLNIENIDEALKTSGARMIDLSSGIEKIRGEKSPQLIKEFIKKINKLSLRGQAP